MMRKIVTAVLSIMTLCAGVIYAEEPSGWASEKVRAAIEFKIVPTYLQTEYKKTVTRAEFCALGVALYEEKTGTVIKQMESFSDTADINVRKMAGLGIVSGMGDKRFEPDRLLSREQAAIVLLNLYQAMGGVTKDQGSFFEDQTQIASWAVDAVAKVQGTGIMSGMKSGRFEPKGNYTREQSIVTMYNLYIHPNIGGSEQKDTTPSSSTQQPKEQPNEVQAVSTSETKISALDREGFAQEIREEFYLLVNEHRKNHGLRELAVNPQLQIYADLRAAEQRQLFGHQRPDGSAAGSGWYDSKNIMNTRFAENALGKHRLDFDAQKSAEYIFSRWKNSQGHNRHMLYDFDEQITMALGLDLQIENGQWMDSPAIWATGY